MGETAGRVMVMLFGVAVGFVFVRFGGHLWVLEAVGELLS